MPKTVCVWRGTDAIDNAIDRLDESKVQLLFSKFPVGSGTFKRNKFIYVQYIGPKCGIVKRGLGISEITGFTAKTMLGVPGFSTTDKSDLSFESLVRQLRTVFVTDNGTFSLEQIKEEYKTRLKEEQKMMHDERNGAAGAPNHRQRRNTAPVVRIPKAPLAAPPPPPPAPVEEKPVLSSAEQMEQTNRVLESLREDNGSINWAVFNSDPNKLSVRSYGRQGIFELVKNLPDNEWLFGLFRISFFTGENRQRRMIFFQWIGSQLKAVRSNGSAGIYPSMAKALSPYSYEIYLVGRQDLNPQAIINKSKNAFSDPHKKMANSKDFLMDSCIFTEENYKKSLDDEQKVAEAFNEKPKNIRRNQTPTPRDRMEQSISSLALTDGQLLPTFDIDETIALVQADEGGLVWAIFEVR